MFIKMYNIYETVLSALNASGRDASEKNQNVSKLKTYTFRGVRYPYVSGQAFKFYLRSTLEEIKSREEFIYDTVGREEEVLDSSGIVLEKLVNYPGLDVFGYMVTAKNKRALRRRAILLASPMFGLISNFTLDLVTKRVSEEATEKEKKTSYSFKELSTSVFYNVIDFDTRKLGIYQPIETGSDKIFDVSSIDKNYKTDVIRDVLMSVFNLRGGANQARNLADISPVISIVVLTNKINTPVNLRPSSSKTVSIDRRIADYFEKVYRNDMKFIVVNEHILQNSQIEFNESAFENFEYYPFYDRENLVNNILEIL